MSIGCRNGARSSRRGKTVGWVSESSVDKMGYLNGNITTGWKNCGKRLWKRPRHILCALKILSTKENICFGSRLGRQIWDCRQTRTRKRWQPFFGPYSNYVRSKSSTELLCCVWVYGPAPRNRGLSCNRDPTIWPGAEWRKPVPVLRKTHRPHQGVILFRRWIYPVV